MVERGKWNINIAVLGVPGTGKSTEALKRAFALAHSVGGAYIIAHDAGHRLPDAWPTGAPTGLRRYYTVEELRQAVATNPRGAHAVITPDASAVIEYARDLGKASLAKNGGSRGVPVILVLDEAVGVASMNPHRIGEDIKQLIATRRHENVGLIWTAQSPTMAHYQLLGLANLLVIFRLTDKRALDRLGQLGVTDETLARIRSLPDHTYIEHKL